MVRNEPIGLPLTAITRELPYRCLVGGEEWIFDRLIKLCLLINPSIIKFCC
ncbi:hypothetical protein NIES39_J04280 [Arthrospira platensis NIES-39]|nr:hypothetical protein NIES39_J04280 [Arthrospira platensis NIES-39]